MVSIKEITFGQLYQKTAFNICDEHLLVRNIFAVNNNYKNNLNIFSIKPIAVTLDNTKMGCRLGNAFQEIISILYEHMLRWSKHFIADNN